ncbi:MAG: hypothetical protein FWC70_10300 [Defluviitaleaceae bacterium]|nr:hypothetical protein [Defluviitaleaceae bacterium]
MTLILSSCPLGSSCCGGFPDFGGERFEGGGRCGGGACGSRSSCGGGGHGHGRHGMGMGGWNWLGSVTVIPCEAIASFTHNAI